MKGSNCVRLVVFVNIVLMFLTDAFQVAPSSSTIRSFYTTASASVKEQKRKTKSPKEEDDEVVPLPPVIQSIAEERVEYQMNVGKAMDSLRRDYQDVFTKKPGSWERNEHNIGDSSTGV